MRSSEEPAVCMKENLATWLRLTLCVVLALLTVLSSAIAGAKKPLREDQLLALLSRGVRTSRVAMLVRERGITFVPTAGYLDKLRQAGADKRLVEAVAAARIPRTYQGTSIVLSVPVKPHSEQRVASVVSGPNHATGGMPREATASPI